MGQDTRIVTRYEGVRFPSLAYVCFHGFCLLESVGKRIGAGRADTRHIVVSLLRVKVPVATFSNIEEMGIPRAFEQAINAWIHPTKARSLNLVNFQLQGDIDGRAPRSSFDC